MEDIIFCLVGESGSGKITVSHMLHKGGINVIQSYTNRPPREPNEWGHIFVSYSDLRNTSKKDFIAYVFYNQYHYWATRQQYKGFGATIYVIDPKGLDLLRRLVTDVRIVVIYLKTDVKIRRMRMRRQNRTSKEINQRLEVDKEVFKFIVCDYVVDTDFPLVTVFDRIYEIIVKETMIKEVGDETTDSRTDFSIISE